MKSVSREKQAKPDAQPEYKSVERPGLTLAEKSNTQYFETDAWRRHCEPELLVVNLRRVIGDNEVLPEPTQFRKSDELARILGYARFDNESTLSERTKLTLDEAIEVCFQHSDVYKLALELFRLDLAGELVGHSSAYEAMQEILQKGER